MSVSAPHKRCPVCEAPAPLDARFCSSCGHAYRTVFTQDPGITQIAGPQPALPPTLMSGGVPYAAYGAAAGSDKSKVAAGLFAFFLGGFGAHGFYLNNTAMGLTILGCNFMGIAFVMLGAIFSFLIFPIGLALVGGAILTGVSVLCLIQAVAYWAASDADFHRRYVVEKRWI